MWDFSLGRENKVLTTWIAKILILLPLRLHQGPDSYTKKALDTVDSDMKGLAVGSYAWKPTQSQLAINFKKLSIVDLQYCVTFMYTAKLMSYVFSDYFRL